MIFRKKKIVDPVLVQPSPKNARLRHQLTRSRENQETLRKRIDHEIIRLHRDFNLDTRNSS